MVLITFSAPARNLPGAIYARSRSQKLNLYNVDFVTGKFWFVLSFYFENFGIGIASMQFIVHALDRKDAQEQRLAILSKHREFLDVGPEKFGVTVLMSGPLNTDDGETMIGSFFLLSAKKRQPIESMFAADPLAIAGVWESVDISRVTIRQNNIGPIVEDA